MAPPATREVLNVFLASPIDVLAERTVAQEVVSRLNKGVGRHFGLHIDLHMWEDIGPGYGDPQQRINPDVDECDLFIGLLWERWGNPTAKYSSGFEEEFERAVSRRRSTGRPEIWLVFKAPRAEKLDEPGPELSKVLKFRESLKSSREVHFAQVKNGDAWRGELQNWLLEHVIGQIKVVQLQPVSAPPAPTASRDDSVEATETNVRTAEEVPAQLVQLSNSIREVIRSGRLEFAPDEEDHLSEFDISRLHLLSATWMARRYASDFLGTHQVNLLYKHRDRLEATPSESHQLLRTLLHDTSGVIPGWYWFRRAFPDGLAEMLLSMATKDPNAELRVDALELMASAPIAVPRELLASIPLLDEPAVSDAAFKYLGLVGDESALTLIDEAARKMEDDSLDSATEARYRILIRTDPRRAFSQLVSSGDGTLEDLAGSFESVSSKLAKDDLLKGAASPLREIRRVSVRELARRGELALELAETLRRDSSIDVKQVALQEIVNKRGDPELRELRESLKSSEPLTLSALAGGLRREIDLSSLQLNYYRTLSTDKLLEIVTWSSIDGAPAYKILATDRYESVSSVLRGDLATGFERIRGRWLEDVTSRLGADYAQELAKGYDKDRLGDFIRRQFTEAALSGLAIHTEPSDVHIAREYLQNRATDTGLLAVKILSKLGGEEDVAALLSLADEAWGELKQLALATAIRLSPSPSRLALQMAGTGDTERNRVAFEWLVEQDDSEVQTFFRAQLLDESTDNRMRGIYYLWRKLSPPELERLLGDYPGDGTYYYDVVTWLDRLLYAPGVLKDMFARELEGLARG